MSRGSRLRVDKQKRAKMACVELLRREGVWLFTHQPKLDVIFGMAERALKLEPWPDGRSKAKRVDRLLVAFGMDKKQAVKTAKRRQKSEDFYASREWQTVRYRVLRKASGECMACGRSRAVHGVVLHIDHIKPRYHHPELELDEGNLQVLCADCNMGKGAWDQTDWR